MKTNFRRCAFVALLALMTLTAMSVSASTFVALDSDAMIQQSDRVVQGDVISTNSFWDEAGRIVVTEATIRVQESILGDSNDSVIKVRTAGGQVGRFRVEASGFPSFRTGEQVILFLKNEQGKDYQRVVGFQQGHFEVVRRNDGVNLAVPQIEQGTRLFFANGRQMAPARSMELEEFKTMVRERGRSLNRPVAR